MSDENLNQKYRWELLRRNDEYKSDLDELKKLEEISEQDADIFYEQILERWGITFLIETSIDYSTESFIKNKISFFTEEQRTQIVAKGVLTYRELPSYVKMNEIEGFETFKNKFDVGDKANDRRFAMVIVDLGADTKTRGNSSGGNAEFRDVSKALTKVRSDYRKSIGRMKQYYYEDELDLLLFIHDRILLEGMTRDKCIELVNDAWTKKYPKNFGDTLRINDASSITQKAKEVTKLISNINYFPYVVKKGFSPQLKSGSN